MDKYHTTHPPTELKSAVLGRQSSAKRGESPTPAGSTTLVSTPVLQECLENLYELSGEWAWKRGAGKRNQQVMDELDILIGKVQRSLGNASGLPPAEGERGSN